jgi:hypothetical protein
MDFSLFLVHRILASRQYSQKYRLKQLQYIMQLEAEVKALQVIYISLLTRMDEF